MSQSNEINFGPVFMRGRKPAPVTGKPATTSSTNNNPPSNPTQNQFSQAQRPSTATMPNTAPKTVNHPTPTLGSFSPATNTSSLPLPKSFSAAVSPGKEIDSRALHPNGTLNNAWEVHQNQSFVESTPHVNGHQVSAPADYSRETLLNLYSENLATKLPPDLEINDPAITLEFVGPPMALLEMTEAEKELFAGTFNSEKRSAANKVQPHHNIHDHSLGVPASPETAVNHSLGNNNKLSVGGPVKLGKHSTIERFNNLGIQGGVLAGVASPTHANARRRGENELDSNESPRRFQRTEDPAAQVAPWTGTPRDRRTRDLAPPSDGKWKRGVSFEEKLQASQDSPGGGANLKYSVADKMREKAAGNPEASSKEGYHSHHSTARANDRGGTYNASNESSDQSRQSGEAFATDRTFDETEDLSSPIKGDSGHQEQVSSSAHTSSAGANQSTNDLNPENIAWQYRDPSGTVQGPFTAFQMQEWYNATFFRDDLLVKRVIDVAFETLETLMLRVGDRDRPFLSRPPPVLPPNLPLPQAHNHQPSTSSPRLPLSNLLDQTSSLSTQTESLSAVDPTPPSNSSSVPNQHASISAPDPWNGIVPGGSPLLHPGNIPASTPLASGPGWNSSQPAYTGHPNTRGNDYAINDGLIDFNNVNLLNNGLMPNLPHSFMSSDTLRFLQHAQHAQHPALSMAAANGYPFPLPLPPQPPNFGQIPSMPHLSNAAMSPILAAQLHSQLMGPYLFNNMPHAGGQGVEPQVERPSHDNIMPHLHHADPWQASPQPPNDSSVGATDRNSLQSTSMTSNHDQPAFAPQPDEGGIHEPAPPVDAPQKMDAIRQSLQYPSDQQASEPKSSVPEQTHANSKSRPVSAVNPDKQVMTLPATAIHTPTITSLSNTDSPASVEKESVVPQAPAPTESTRDSLPPQSPSTAAPENAPTSEQTNPNQSWRNVTHQPTAKPPSIPRNSASVVPPSSKSSGKVVVLSKAQQDEQDRRTASIHKAQLQLKEAQAVERAAREASEAAAAATASSFNTPAPWLKEEKTTSNLSLTEIQAIEAKQSEKRRLAEKQAAANRAMVEQTMAAERAMKAAKETLPATSNWATTSSSPTKQSSGLSGGTVWGSKESETPSTLINGPKQSMKQIQEEEARKKSIALQQQQASRPSATPGAVKTMGGYAGTVASNKPAVSGPWAVVGAKSKVIAPPTTVPARSSVVGTGPVRIGQPTGTTATTTPTTKHAPKNVTTVVNKPTSKSSQSASNNGVVATAISITTISNNSNLTIDGPPPASPEFMKWLREALRGMNNVDDFVKMLLDFPVNPDESVLEIVSDSVYAGSATLDGRRFAKEFNARRIADVNSRGGRKIGGGTNGNGILSPTNNLSTTFSSNGSVGTGVNRKPGYLNISSLTTTTTSAPSSGGGGTMADALKLQPTPKNDGWGFAVVGAKKKKK
ncbi:hypothetical protein MJO29_005734 [Puccinia striiformis f. sp. tritici]|nr:hypothetical protein Pst134EB_010939 [Puccinia striiformis f. sp. tritici]KAI7960666.1 hypothetical protein MJO29_005734 [Puccinia striiformis f. sp. tritici]